MIPKRSGDRVKTDRRDSQMLARLHRAGELRAIYVPDDTDDAMRALVRAREDAVVVGTQAKARLKAFLLRQGRRYPGRDGWTLPYRRRLTDLSFPTAPQHITLQEYRDTIDETERRIARVTEQLRQLAPTWRWAPVVAALQALRGVAFITAVALVAELGDLTRFGHPRELMAYLGLVPSEYSRWPSVRRGAITKAGNPHARRLLAEAAWAYQGIPRIGRQHAYRQEALPKVVCDIAWKAQTPTDDALPAAGRAWESETKGRHRDRARAHGLHLGDCAGGVAGVVVRATRVQDVFVHRSFRRYGDQVENPRER
jgi:transposase